MHKIKNLLPLKRPHEKIRMEVAATDKYYLCPDCLEVFHATLVTNVVYDHVVDRSMEGVVARSRYFCPACRDYAFEVDPLIISSVRRLLAYGVITISSCSGHWEKFRDVAFDHEDGLLGVDGVGDYCTYGACISMHPPEDEKNKKRFKYNFDKLKEKYKDNEEVAIFLNPDNFSANHFIICPVSDVREFRKSGLDNREGMIIRANSNMDKVTRELVKGLDEVIHPKPSRALFQLINGMAASKTAPKGVCNVID